jgi:hypothetical protein
MTENQPFSYEERLTLIAQFIREADFNELFFINDMIGTELRARHERYLGLQAENAHLKTQRCLLTTCCEIRIASEN